MYIIDVLRFASVYVLPVTVVAMKYIYRWCFLFYLIYVCRSFICCREPLLDYLQVMMVGFAENFRHPPPWYTRPQPIAPPIRDQQTGSLCARDPDTGEPKYCRRCRDDQEFEKSKKRQRQESSGNGSMTKKRIRLRPNVNKQSY
uniref:Uncharacterized protein n=1 Tax=Aplanochytrium stocchinoi TaxID=215587 RepID=A0A7S3PJN3_9STRA|mmetsp:Transcript_7537/g.9589  ORF Transcript_7537/g.9589 Transcript_7537/m.9589 type:complete len:144 (+) Transcript_7537:135-566(+)